MIILSLIVRILIILVFAHAIMSWIRPDPYNPIVRMINQIVEPMLAPIRQIMPPSGGVDFSPMILLVIFFIIQTLLAGF